MLSRDIDRYLTAAAQAGLSEASLDQYRWHLERMAAWLNERGVEQTGQVDRWLLREWGAGLREHWSVATIRQAVSIARTFFSWCYEEELVTQNAGHWLKAPRLPKRIHRTLNLNEIQQLMDACDLRTIKGKRDRALISILVDTGLRAAEVCRASLRKLDLANRRLIVRVKRGNEGLAAFGQATAKRLDEWLCVRPANDGVDQIFVSLGGLTPGEGLTTEGLRVILRRLGNAAGVEGVSPHAFRRSFACIATDLGAPSRTVQLAGRWSDIRMVEVYTRALDQERMYQNWSPADRLVDP